MNWNRCYLLKKAVESYLATTRDEDVELFIIDNASTDESKEYLQSLETRAPVRVIYLNENIGGEAYNYVVSLARGELIHLSENDQEFLPGWITHVREAFDRFPDLGQLSLFHSVPTDDEAWEAKPCHLRFKSGKILYEAHGNVGTSSVIRGTLFRERQLKVSNIEHGSFKFPDDGQLSSDVKASGYWVAWSDRYYVRNIGHHIDEFEAHSQYYEANYASKRSVGISGWRSRIAQQKQLAHVNRNSVVMPQLATVPEKTMHPVGDKPARFWSMVDGQTAEVEVLDFLYALVRLIKPRVLLETGTWLGWSACAIGAALKANGFGHLTTLEIDTEAHTEAVKNLKRWKVDAFVDAILMSSMDYAPTRSIDFVILDSELSLRGQEFDRYRRSLGDGAMVVVHDTAAHHRVVGEAVRELVTAGTLVGLELPTPRGIFIGKHRAEANK